MICIPQGNSKENWALSFSEVREITFKSWPYTDGPCIPKNLAKAGFYFTSEDCVKCFYCEKELGGWEREDEPMEEHKKHASYCPLVQHVKSGGNLTINCAEAYALHVEKLCLKIDMTVDECIKKITSAYLRRKV